MNLFITGGSGFVGTNLLLESNFLKKFKKIYCLTRKKNIKDVNKKIIWITGNLNSNLTKYFKKSDCLLHMAAHSANRPYDNLYNCFKWNCLSSMNLIEKAFNEGIKKFIIIGTYHEYGFAGQLHKNKKTSTKSFCLPLSTYALSKSFFFQTIFSWSLGKDVSIKYLRLPHVFGEGELKTRLWPQIKENKLKKIAINNPNFMTNFINIKKLTKKLNNYIDFKNIKKNFFEIKNVLDKDMSLYNFAIKEKKSLNSKVKIIKSTDRKNLWKFLIPKNDKFLIKIK